jgi:hypothetical protein
MELKAFIALGDIASVVRIATIRRAFNNFMFS